MAELKIDAEEFLSFDGFYYDHRLKLTVKKVNAENFEKVMKKLKDLCGDNIYDGNFKVEEFRDGCEELSVPPLDLIEKKRYSFCDLMRIMYILTAENGCEWDKAQTMKSICPNMIEEAYELVTAIYNNDRENIIEEAGDVMLQSVFHCVLAEKDELFDTTDVISNLCKKLITRHTHIFGNVKASTPEQALAAWESAKSKEKNYKKASSKMDLLPACLPADERAAKALKYAAKAEIGETDILRAAEKVEKDIKRIKAGENAASDLIWDAIVLLRLLKTDAEVALNEKLEKFIKAFKYAEERAGGDIMSVGAEERRKFFGEYRA